MLDLQKEKEKMYASLSSLFTTWQHVTMPGLVLYSIQQSCQGFEETHDQ